MVSYSDALRPMTEERVRQIVREEIAAAFRVLDRAADHLDGYDTAELDSRALSNISEAAHATVRRLTCSHEYSSAWGPRCSRCGEPETAPADPFEEKS